MRRQGTVGDCPARALKYGIWASPAGFSSLITQNTGNGGEGCHENFTAREEVRFARELPTRVRY